MTYKLDNKNGVNVITWGTSTDIIEHEDTDEYANIMYSPLPGSNSASTDGFDSGGVVRIITLTCVAVRTSAANIATFVSTLRGMLNGEQTSDNNYPYKYTSTIEGTDINVKFLGIPRSTRQADPLRLRYTIKMVECAADTS